MQQIIFQFNVSHLDGPTADPNAEEELTAEEKNVFLLRQVECLQHRLSTSIHKFEENRPPNNFEVMQTNKATETDSVVEELRHRLTDLQGDLRNERSRCFDLAVDMTRQYKAMRAELTKQIDSLQDEITTYQDKLGTPC